MTRTATDATQTNVTPATLARRIRRVSLLLEAAADRYDVLIIRLDGYLSVRAADAGEAPRTVLVAATHGWMPGTGRYSVSGATVDTVADDKPRTLNLYKAARVTACGSKTHATLRAAGYQVAEARHLRAAAAADAAGDYEAAAVETMAARQYGRRYWQAVAG